MTKYTKILTGLTFGLLISVSSAAEKTEEIESKENATKIKDTSDWYKDPLCQMLFNTVLQGLYNDGVPKEAAELIVAKAGEGNIGKNFYFRCELCHACFEAFAAYAKAPAFRGTGGVVGFSNKKFDEKIMEGLKARSATESSRAMGALVYPYIKVLVDDMDLRSNEERLKAIKRFSKLAAKGNAFTNSYLRCEACEAVKALVGSIEDDGAAKK